MTLTLDQLRSNRNVLFWTLHAAGWAAYAISQYFGALLYEKPLSYQQVIAIAAVAGFVLSMPMRYIYRRLWGLSLGRSIGRRADHLLRDGVRPALGHQYLLSSARRARMAVQDAVRVRAGRAVHDVSAAVLERAVFRHQILRDAAEAARGDAALRGAGAGGAAQDAALPAESALPVQYPQCHLHADPRQPEPHGESRGDAAIGIPALHARSGSGEESDAAGRRSRR